MDNGEYAIIEKVKKKRLWRKEERVYVVLGPFHPVLGPAFGFSGPHDAVKDILENLGVTFDVYTKV